MRKQYHARQTENGRLIWDVHSLICQSKNLPIIEVQLNSIAELNENYWYAEEDGNIPTPKSIAEHMILVEAACLSHPVILCADHKLMDGMHRCVKAYLQGDKIIKAVKFKNTPKPDYKNIPLESLSYDEEEIPA